VKDYSVVVKPLTVLKSPNVDWTWSSAQQKAFNEVKQRLTSAPILASPVNGKPFCLCTDASDYAIGAVLEQEGKDGQWHFVAYGSRSLTDAERKWSSAEKECFAVVHFMNHWWHLLLGAQFEVLTGHQALSWMFGQAEPPTGKLARWVSKMQPFKPFNVKCWPSGNCDALSRELKTGQVATICKDVEQWVKSCRMCQEHLDPQALKAARQQLIKTMQALKKMGMDLIGPLPQSKQGHVYALVMQGYFTKWPEVIPLKDATAKSVAGALFWVILTWGPPAELLSNQGPEFVAELNCELSRQWGIKRQYAMAYHPQTNRQVEQFNRMLKTMIAKFVNGRQDNWDFYLLAFLYAYRTSPHKSTGHTPYKAMLGRAQPSKDRAAKELIPMDEWVQELRVAQEEARKLILPTSKVSSRTEWSQCPIGQERGKLVTRSRYRLIAKARASQRQVGAQQPQTECGTQGTPRMVFKLVGGGESSGFPMEFQSPTCVPIFAKIHKAIRT